MKKNYTWLIGIGNANTKNDKSKLHAYLKLGSKLIVSLWLVLGFTKLNAQTSIFPTAPSIEWEKSYWPSGHPSLGTQTREKSGEDWFYSVALSKTYGIQDGYVCAGYNSFPGYSVTETIGCLADGSLTGAGDCEEFEKSDHKKGMVLGQISFIDLDGSQVWQKNFLQGELTKVIQTSDGNYLAVGTTRSTQSVKYNPSSNSSNNLFRKDYECGESRNKRKACLIKVDKNGEIIWQYIYGIQDFSVDANLAYNQNTFGFDILKHEGHYYISGNATNPNEDDRINNYVIKVNASGFVIQKSFVGNLSYDSKGGTIAKKGSGINTMFAVGCETRTGSGTGKANIVVLDNNLSTINQFEYEASQTLSARVWNIVFNANGELLLPLVTNCEKCRDFFHGDGDFKVLKINMTLGHTDFGVIIQTTEFGNAIAYDLRPGITNTTDGGFAVITSKMNLVQNYRPDFRNNTEYPFCDYRNITKYWRTCGYIAKCDANGQVEWKRQWDAKTPRQSGTMDTWTYPNLKYDVKTQECMYGIVQNDDGSYTVAGNNSTNFDDDYLVKINGDCDLRVANSNFDIVNNSNSSSIYPNYKLIANETWNTSKKVKASIIIPYGKTLTINGTRTTTSSGSTSSTIIEFADSRKTGVRTNIIVEPGGRLIINGAMLTSLASCAGTNSKWDGILVEGSPTLDQMTRANQGYVQLNDAIIENALNAISTSSYYFTPNLDATILWAQTGGGIINADNTIFRKNKRHIEFMAYKNNITINGKTQEYDNKSSFINCTFELAGSNYVTNLNNTAKRTMVTAWGVKGVRFNACDFKNTDGTVNVEKANYDRGTGVYALDASLNIYGSLNNCTVNKLGTFYDLSTGIQNVWSAGLPQMSMYSYLEFTKNDKSIILASGNTATIHNNKFDLNIPANYYNKAYSTNGNQLKTGIVGVLANEMGGYLIERNEFKDNSKSTKIIIGSVLNNSDVFGTGAKVRINWYTDNAIGLQTQFNNKDIEITCNRFKDLNSSGMLMNPNSNLSETPKFGECDPNKADIRKDYNNAFISNTSFDAEHFQFKLDATNTLQPVIKTYVVQPTASDIPVTTYKVNVNKCIGVGSVTLKDNCSTTPAIDCDNRMIANPNDGKTKYNDSKTQITNLTNAINSGNLTSTGLRDAINEREYYQTELAQGRGEVLWAYNAWEGMDSTINAMDSITAFLIGETDLESKKILVATYYNAGKLSEANNLLEEIESDGSDELANFLAYYNLLIAANLDNRNIFQLNDEEWITLETIAATRSSAAESAKGILTLVKDYNFDAYIEKGISGEESAMMAKNTAVIPTEITNSINKLNVYPNPANNIINISYSINELTQNTTICLLDITGKQVFSQLINEKNGTIQLDALSLNSGFYFVRLSNGKTINTTSKIIITH